MNEVELILTVGAPGSGKTTWANEQKKQAGTYVVCLDDNRVAISDGGYKYSRHKEGLVKNLQYAWIKTYLNYGHTKRIIVADTNLNPKTRETIIDVAKAEADKLGIKLKLGYQTFDLDWRSLVNRNNKRGDKAVPIDVLRDFYKKMQIYLGKHLQYEPDTSKQKAIIVDIDGTLANNNHRSPFDLSQCCGDTLREHVAHLVAMYKKDNHKIILVSGRHDGDIDPVTKQTDRRWRIKTMEWLTRNKIQYDALYMRKAGDSRSDDIVKEEIFWDNIAQRYNVKVAIDDRQQVVEMWRRIGVECFQVNFGDF